MKVVAHGFFYSPMVPRPPTRRTPKRENGVDKVVMLGVMLRMTMTWDGFAGMSFDVMVNIQLSCCGICRVGFVVCFSSVGDAESLSILWSSSGAHYNDV